MAHRFHNGYYGKTRGMVSLACSSEDSMTMYQVVKTSELPDSIADGMDVYSISRNDGKKGKSGIVAVMPTISESVFNVFINDEAGKAFVVDSIHALRSKVASAIHAKGNTITDDTIGITALLVMAKQETESQRMTKESIGEWFDADLASLIATRIQDKLVTISQDKLDKLVAGYRAKFQTLSGRDVSMPLPVKAQLIKAMELLPDDYEHVIGIKVMEALTKAEEATETLAAL